MTHLNDTPLSGVSNQICCMKKMYQEIEKKKNVELNIRRNFKGKKFRHKIHFKIFYEK